MKEERRLKCFDEILKECENESLEWVEKMQKLLEENFYEFWFTDTAVFAWRDEEFVRYNCDTGNIVYYDSLEELKEALLFLDERAEILFSETYYQEHH